MATHDLTANEAGIVWQNKHAVLTKEVNFASGGNVGNAAQNDVVQVFKQPAYTKAIAGSIRVITAEGGTLTFDLGYTGGVVDVLVDGADGNAAAGSIADTGSTGETRGAAVIPTSADTIDLLVKNAADAAKVFVTVELVDYRREADLASLDNV